VVFHKAVTDRLSSDPKETALQEGRFTSLPTMVVVVDCFRIAILFANQQKCGLMADICRRLDNSGLVLGCQYLMNWDD